MYSFLVTLAASEKDIALTRSLQFAVLDVFILDNVEDFNHESAKAPPKPLVPNPSLVFSQGSLLSSS